jgi:hypothetical protein
VTKRAQLGRTGIKCLKVLHILCAGCWFGGAVALLFLNSLNDSAIVGPMLYGINLSAHFVDMCVVVACGAYGCLTTGLLYALFTPWGFFRHRWIICKWIITILASLSGTFLLGRWEVIMLEQSQRLGLAAFFDPAFSIARSGQFFGGLAQLALLFFAVVLSVFKPWSKKPDAL